MSNVRHQITPSVFLIFRDGKKVCMLRRFQTGWRDGEYTLPAGHIEKNESVIMAAIREAAEEVGVRLKPNDLEFVHVVNRRAEERDHERVDFFFEVKQYAGKLINNEPNKCDELAWLPLNELPENTVPPIKQALNGQARGEYYSEYDWAS